jgi:carboxyl-terminal processing protease
MIKKCSVIFLFMMLVGCTPSKPEARFSEAYSIVKKEYIKPVSDDELMNNAIRGMLEGLDPNSTYLNKKQLDFFNTLVNGQYVGIGVEVSPDEDSLKVISPIDDSPAQKAGILAGDHIVEANRKSFSTMDFLEMIQSLKGPIGSTVEITVIRNHANKLLYFNIMREKLNLQTIKTQLYPKGIGYLRLAFFEENAPAQTKKAIELLEKQNKGPLKGLIIDVRNNPGGVLQSATGVVDLFLDARTLGQNPLIVYSKNRTGAITYTADADNNDILNGIPMIVLINKGSASGAEILAGALHDHHRAVLLGSRTFGKGSVQAVIPLKGDDGAIKLTIGLYYTPNGTSIDHVGIAPDIEVKTRESDKADVQLNQALQELGKMSRNMSS